MKLLGGGGGGGAANPNTELVVFLNISVTAGGILIKLWCKDRTQLHQPFSHDASVFQKCKPAEWLCAGCKLFPYIYFRCEIV